MRFYQNSSVTNYNSLILNSLPEFYKEVVLAFNNCKDKTFTNLANQNIWLNKNICFKSKPLFFPNWTKGGLLLVKDLFNDNGFKTVNEIKEKLASTNNFLCEYLMVKTALKKHYSRNNMQTINFLNTNANQQFYFDGKFEDISN